MAKSTAERSKEYRQRLKEAGAKQLRVTLSSKEVQFVEAIGELDYPGLELDQVMRQMLMAVCKRSLLVAQEYEKLKAIDKWCAEDYLKRMRHELEAGCPFTAEDYLEHRNEMKEIDVIRLRHHEQQLSNSERI